jgi:hypothetical protein
MCVTSSGRTTTFPLSSHSKVRPTAQHVSLIHANVHIIVSCTMLSSTQTVRPQTREHTAGSQRLPCCSRSGSRKGHVSPLCLVSAVQRDAPPKAKRISESTDTRLIDLGKSTTMHNAQQQPNRFPSPTLPSLEM